jgi:hypothetical protein
MRPKNLLFTQILILSKYDYSSTFKCLLVLLPGFFCPVALSLQHCLVTHNFVNMFFTQLISLHFFYKEFSCLFGTFVECAVRVFSSCLTSARNPTTVLHPVGVRRRMGFSISPNFVVFFFLGVQTRHSWLPSS